MRQSGPLDLACRSASSKPKFPAVTILIGFTARDAVVLASDSQTTYLGLGAKDLDAKKVVSVALPSGGSVALAKCGSLAVADYFQEQFEILLAHASITHTRAIADLAEAAMRTTHRRLLLGLREEGASPDELRQQLCDNDCECLLGYMQDEKPNLYSLNLQSLLAIKICGPFHVTGSGANLARSILSGFDLSGMSSTESLAVAAYAIEITKKFDEYCSGKTQIAVVLDRLGSSDANIIDEESSHKYASVCDETYHELKLSLPSTLGSKARAAFPMTVFRGPSS